MTTNLRALAYEIKLWVVNEKGEAVFGDGLAALLEDIDKTNSMLESAQNLRMSYRYLLHRITLAEKRLGKLLVNRSRGGAKGGGFSQVTPFGKELCQRYRKARVELGKVLKTLP